MILKLNSHLAIIKMQRQWITKPTSRPPTEHNDLSEQQSHSQESEPKLEGSPAKPFAIF
jgi:hypothetical protein